MAGGRGMSPNDVKDLTIYEVLLYAADERAVKGTQKRPADAVPYEKKPPKKWLDPLQRERELYERHFGQPAPF